MNRNFANEICLSNCQFSHPNHAHTRTRQLHTRTRQLHTRTWVRVPDPRVAVLYSGVND